MQTWYLSPFSPVWHLWRINDKYQVWVDADLIFVTYFTSRIGGENNDKYQVWVEADNVPDDHIIKALFCKLHKSYQAKSKHCQLWCQLLVWSLFSTFHHLCIIMYDDDGMCGQKLQCNVCHIPSILYLGSLSDKRFHPICVKSLVFSVVRTPILSFKW